VKSVAARLNFASDRFEGVWLGELTHLVPRAYVFTPYWNVTADPALQRALRTLITDPTADVDAVLGAAARQAQENLDRMR
jgi:hypothetical protein